MTKKTCHSSNNLYFSIFYRLVSRTLLKENLFLKSNLVSMMNKNNDRKYIISSWTKAMKDELLITEENRS